MSGRVAREVTGRFVHRLAEWLPRRGVDACNRHGNFAIVVRCGRRDDQSCRRRDEEDTSPYVSTRGGRTMRASRGHRHRWPTIEGDERINRSHACLNAALIGGTYPAFHPANTHTAAHTFTDMMDCILINANSRQFIKFQAKRFACIDDNLCVRFMVNGRCQLIRVWKIIYY